METSEQDQTTVETSDQAPSSVGIGTADPPSVGTRDQDLSSVETLVTKLCPLWRSELCSSIAPWYCLANKEQTLLFPELY